MKTAETTKLEGLLRHQQLVLDRLASRITELEGMLEQHMKTAVKVAKKDVVQ